MTFNVDPAMLALGIGVVGWIFRVDRKLTKIETWIKSCKFCRESVSPDGKEGD